MEAPTQRLSRFKHADLLQFALDSKANNEYQQSQIDRKDILLKAAYDLLKKCEDTPFVQDALTTTVFYDDADCDGSCLMEDIASELDLSEE